MTPTEMTAAIHKLLAQVADLSASRRAAWYQLNKAGARQQDLAAEAGVAKQTVYLEIRRHREDALGERRRTGDWRKAKAAS